MDQNFLNPADFQNLVQGAAPGVGGNAAAAGVGYGANIRSAQAGKMGALQQLALYKIRNAGYHQKMMNNVENEIRQLGYQGQQAGPTDYLGVALGGVNAIQGADQRAKMNQMYPGGF